MPLRAASDHRSSAADALVNKVYPPRSLVQSHTHTHTHTAWLIFFLYTTLQSQEVLASLELNGFAVIDGILTPESTSEV